jgi:hypothetical protein
MQRSAIGRLAAGAVAVTVLAVYLLPCAMMHRPLSPGKVSAFYAPVARSIPAHLTGKRNLWATMLARRESLTAPRAQTAFTVNGQRVTMPLPPETVAGGAMPGGMQRFVTFSSPDEYLTYVDSVLPAAGWRLREHLGSTYAYEREGMQLSVHRRHHLGTRIGQLTIGVRRANTPPPHAE